MIKFMIAAMAVFVAMALLQPTPSEGSHIDLNNAPYYLTLLEMNKLGELASAPRVEGVYATESECIEDGTILGTYLDLEGIWLGIVACIPANVAGDFTHGIDELINKLGKFYITGWSV